MSRGVSCKVAPPLAWNLDLDEAAGMARDFMVASQQARAEQERQVRYALGSAPPYPPRLTGTAGTRRRRANVLALNRHALRRTRSPWR